MKSEEERRFEELVSREVRSKSVAISALRKAIVGGVRETRLSFVRITCDLDDGLNILRNGERTATALSCAHSAIIMHVDRPNGASIPSPSMLLSMYRNGRSIDEIMLRCKHCGQGWVYQPEVDENGDPRP